MTEPAARRSRARLCALFFFQSQAQALWYVPFSNVLRAHGLDWATPYAFAGAAVAALVSPLIGGALADEHIPAERLLGILMFFVSTLLALVFAAIQFDWGGGWVLFILLVQQLAFAPTGGLIVATILANLSRPEHEYGPIRVWATLGWIVAGPFMEKVLHLPNTSVVCGYLGAALYLGVSAFSFALPKTPPVESAGPRRWRDLLGRDTLELMREADVRVVFITAALFSMPLAAFYPFTPLYLADAGRHDTSTLMSLGQVTEVISAFLLAPLFARWRLKSILTAGLCFGVLRYALYATGWTPTILLGVSMHGFAYMLYFVAAQLFLERRIAQRFRTRAQALLSLMMAGVGNLIGSLVCGWLRDWCTAGGVTNWILYWSILVGWTVAVLVYFLARFRELEPVRLGLREGELPANTLPGE